MPRGGGGAGAAGEEAARRRKRDDLKARLPALRLRAPPGEQGACGVVVCPISFVNDLPQPGGGGLLAPRMGPPAALRQLPGLAPGCYQWPTLTPHDLGIPLDVASLRAYDVPADRVGRKRADLEGRLDPEDLALVQGRALGGRGPGAAGGGGLAKAAAAARAARDATWLMNTTYLVADDGVRDKHSGAEFRGRAAAGLTEGRDGGAMETFTEGVERSFAEAREPPLHPTKPHLRPVEVLPLVPAPVEPGVEYLQAQYDFDPSEGAPPAAAARAVLHPVLVESTLGKPIEVRGYLVPSGEAAGEEGEEAYRWHREFKSDVGEAPGEAVALRMDDERAEWYVLGGRQLKLTRLAQRALAAGADENLAEARAARYLLRPRGKRQRSDDAVAGGEGDGGGGEGTDREMSDDSLPGV